MAEVKENKDADLLTQISVLNAQGEEQMKIIQDFTATLEAKDAEIEALSQKNEELTAANEELTKKVAEFSGKKTAPFAPKSQSLEERLKEAMKAKEKGTKVYFNEKGDYLFHKSEEFHIVKTREEILKGR